MTAAKPDCEEAIDVTLEYGVLWCYTPASWQVRAMAGHFERTVCDLHVKRYRQSAAFEVKPLGGLE